jgi:hypothetical protein
MKSINVISEELFNKIRGRFPKVTIGDENGDATNEPSQARFFDFDFRVSGRDIGKVSVSISEKEGMTVIYSNDFITDKDDTTQKEWYNFLKELRVFAKKRLLKKFDIRNINKSNLNKRDYKFLAMDRIGGKEMTESKLYGTSRWSYQDFDGARLTIKHLESIDQTSRFGRVQKIGSIFVDNAEGERFKYPYRHISGARAMARHVAEGGTPHDEFGQHIVGLSEELVKLRKFKTYMGRSAVMAESLTGYMDIVRERISTVKKTLESIQKTSNYKIAIETFEPTLSQEVPDDVRENWIDELTIKQFNEELADVFPYIYNLVKEHTQPQELGPQELEEAYAVEYRDPEGRFSVVYDYDKRGYIAIGQGGYENSINPQRFTSLDHAVEHAEEELRLDGAYDDQDTEEASSINGQTISDDDSRWKFSTMDYEEAVKKYGKENVKRGPKNRAGQSTIEILAPANETVAQEDETIAEFMKGLDSILGQFGDTQDDLDELEGDEIDVKINPTGSIEKANTPEQKTPLGEFILSYFDKETGQFPKGETAVLTMIEKDYGEEYITPAKQFIEKINNKVKEHALRKQSETKDNLSRIRELSGI